MIESVNPAMGSAAVSIVDTVLTSPVTPFVAGVAGGAAVAGLVYAIASRPNKPREANQVVIERGGEAQAQRPKAQKARVQQTSAPAQAAEEKSQPAASVYRPRHMSAEQFERTGNIRVRAVEPSAEKAAANYAVSNHATDDYEDIAANYVRQVTFRERMSRRAQGVASVLAERFGLDMMEGVPVIQRADGSVGDVGTVWWENAVGADAIARNNGFADASAKLAIPDIPAISNDESYAARIKANAASISAPFQPEARPATSAERTSASIAMRVALVDEGVYPEKRTGADLDREDVWESALAALDEKIATSQAAVVFSDTVGGSDTLDEPDGLEPDTQFIPFRVPAGHPEVVDTESYVDHLISEEFSRNSSTAVRKSSRRFLRVLDGGTSKTDALRSSEDAYRGRHFAMAAEA